MSDSLNEPDFEPDYTFGHHLLKDFESTQSPGDVGVIMGSRSDWPYMMPCTDMLEELCISFEFGVVSAHRTTGRMRQYSDSASGRGLRVIIACAGGSAALPGGTASDTWIPVLGVAPKKSDDHAVGSMIAMPEGKPLFYMGGGSAPGKNAGAVNAALGAASILALSDEVLKIRLIAYHEKLRDEVPLTCFDEDTK